jgi:SAM-dependent methyltransferase
MLYRKNQKEKEESIMDVERYKSICEIEAGKLKTSPEIHPEDLIFQFVLGVPLFQLNEEKAIEYYFQNGFESAQKLSYILNEICGFKGDKKINLLEFASGYGCVTRHLKNVIPFAEITACDLHPKAGLFMKEKLRTEFLLSTSLPEDLTLDQKFDVVFALSFFSHMPKSSFSRWLRQLSSFLKPGGFLIFTTHGSLSMKLLPNGPFDADGFSFIPNSEQHDIDTAEYGLSATLPKFVTAQIFKDPNCGLEYYHEGHWWGHQDVYVIRRIENEPSISIHPSETESDALVLAQTRPADDEKLIRALNSELIEIKNSSAWRIIQFLWRIRVMLFPHGSRRENAAHKVMNWLRVLRA